MQRKVSGFFLRLLRDESGQTISWLAAGMLAILAMGGASFDVGSAYVAYRQLQGSTNQAVLAGASYLPNSTAAAAAATTYGSQAGSNNASGNLQNVQTNSSFACVASLQKIGLLCQQGVSYNAMQVTQTATTPTFFAKVFGVNSVNLSTTATAAMRGAKPLPNNVAIIVDTTLSMDSVDSNCNNLTQIACALQGVQALLGSLSPSADPVSLFTFPAVSVGTKSIDTNCTTPLPSGENYPYNSSYGYFSMLSYGGWAKYNSNPYSGVPTDLQYVYPSISATSYSPSGSSSPTYQVTSFLSDYRTSNAATSLNSSSTLVAAAGGISGCGGMAPGNYDGDYGTYYAGVLYAAQSALQAEQLNNPGSQNVIIILSDGNATAPAKSGSPDPNSPAMPTTDANGNVATSSGTYPSWVGECGQAVVAAQYAQSKGTKVYSVAYGSEATGCASDVNAGSYPNIGPCATMKDMASSPLSEYYFSDYNVTGGDSNCTSPVTASPTTLSEIFKAIAQDLTTSRLIPNSQFVNNGT